MKEDLKEKKTFKEHKGSFSTRKHTGEVVCKRGVSDL